MSNKIILISDDSDFFEYIIPKIKLRKSDEIFRYSYDSFINKIHILTNSLIILNSDKAEEKVLELLKILKNNPCIVFGLNENENFKDKVLNHGAFEYITPYFSEKELIYKILHTLKISSILEKKDFYRNLLIKNGVISKNNEVFTDYKNILEQELEKISEKSIPTTLVAISPNEKSKFLLQANQIETAILSQIRENDVLLNYAPNKYFLLLYNTDIESAKKVWTKIKEQIPEQIYAGFANAMYKKREQLVNEILNKLHEAINSNKDITANNPDIIHNNFKNYKQHFEKKLKNIIMPVFFQVQQNYNNKLFGMRIEQLNNNDTYELHIKSRFHTACFKVSSAGFTKINIDITHNPQNLTNTKRISFNPEEFESGILEDLLDQFIIEFKKECSNDNT